MVVCYCGKTEQVTAVPLEQCRVVNPEWKKPICLTVVFLDHHIHHHHGNARSHISTKITKTSVRHHPNSPDEAPKDLFLFQYKKDKLRGQRL